jgi:ABC-2 type transport system permease protein
MMQFFAIEWMKVKTYRTFWILFGAFLIFFPLTMYFSASKVMESSEMNRETMMLRSLIGGPFVFPKVWHTSAWIGGLFFIMIGMLFVLLITNEVQYRTHRQNIIDGWSRFDFLKAKLSMMLFLVLTSTVLVFLSGFLVGLIFSSDTSVMMEGLYYVGYFALMATMYLMAAFLISILVKRTGLSIIIYFAFVCIVDNVLWGILTLRNSQAGYFLPLETVDSLVPNPFKPAVLEKRTVSDLSLLIGACAYIALFAYVIKNYFNKIDLKN